MKQLREASERNKEPIREVLATLLPDKGDLLEIASGSGQHAVHMARAFPGIRWQPTDVDPSALASIAAYREEHRLTNLLAPLELDVTHDSWPVAMVDVVLCINMIHIAPWAATEGLVRGAGLVLAAGGFLVTYGPYRFDGQFKVPSNQAFDERLRSQDPSWGVRDVHDLQQAAGAQGLRLDDTIGMPANNHCLVFRRAG